jgi:predicted acetyltransferase
VSGIQTAKDRREVVETFVRAFSEPDWMVRHMRRALFRAPIFDPEHTRVAVAAGRVVGAVTMAPRKIRFGPVTVPAMTVGPVGTDDRHRKRGYAAAAMDDASRYMKENAVLVAYLQGIPDFYYRFGYYPYMAQGVVKVKRKDAEREGRRASMRAMKRSDLPAVRRLYARVTANRTCAAARDKALWDWLIGPGSRTWLFRRPMVVFDQRGRLCGYFTCGHHHEAQLGEVIVRKDEASCRAALWALARDARKREEKEIVLPLPWDDPLAVFIRHYVGSESQMWSGSTGGALLKVVDFPALMHRLAPLLDRRWRDAHSSLRPARFTLASEVGEVGLAVSRRAVKVGAPADGPLARIPRRWLSGVLTGYHAVRDVAARRGASVPAELRPILEILFPTGWPYVYQGDNY